MVSAAVWVCARARARNFACAGVRRRGYTRTDGGERHYRGGARRARDSNLYRAAPIEKTAGIPLLALRGERSRGAVRLDRPKAPLDYISARGNLSSARKRAFASGSYPADVSRRIVISATQRGEYKRARARAVVVKVRDAGKTRRRWDIGEREGGD